MITYRRAGQLADPDVESVDTAVPTAEAAERAAVSMLLVPSPATENLFTMAENLLLRTRACALELGVSLPERQLIYPSPVPADCEQLAVLFDGWSADQTWDITMHCNAFRWMGGFSIVITRCTPALPSRKGAPPSVEQMWSSAKVASLDADVLTCVVTGLDEIGPEMQIITQAPNGGFQTTELDVRIPAFGAF